jgi:hypothetical protein
MVLRFCRVEVGNSSGSFLAIQTPRRFQNLLEGSHYDSRNFHPVRYSEQRLVMMCKPVYTRNLAAHRQSGR